MKVHGGLLIFLPLLLQFRTIYSSIVTPEFEEELGSFINTSMECRFIPGMTLTVVKGKILLKLKTEKNLILKIAKRNSNSEYLIF